ncbi:MAG: hypothetical protein DU489_08535 [Nitrosomonas sp.]|uniref:lipase family protein n=1 Tax=Nitrosomonas sp. TaxID=42353 RepID=UPI0032EBA193
MALITGNNYSEIINGTNDDDTIDGRGGSDFIDGGNGTDTAVFFGKSSDFTVTNLGGAVRVTGLNSAPYWYSNATVKLLNVENVQFNDSTAPQSITASILPDLKGHWDLVGADIRGNQFDGELIFETQLLTPSNTYLEGYFDWIANGTKSFRVNFDAELEIDGTLNFTATALSAPVTGFAAAQYEGAFSLNYQTLTGTWFGNGTIPGTWSASPIPVPNNLSSEELFKAALNKDEELLEGAESIGMIRVMADLSKAAYHLEEHEENSVINDKDPSGNADKAHTDVINQGWKPLNASELGLSPTLSESTFPFTIHEVLDNGFGATKVKNGLSNGFYTHDNAAAFVVRSGDSVAIAFRGTNDNSDNNSMDDGDKIHPDVDEWGRPDGTTGDMTDHYDLLRPILDSIDAYIAVHDIKKVYVTGHSLGGAMAIEYMDNHPDTTVTYSAITFAAPAFTITDRWRKEYDDDERITQIEISEDPVPQTWDLEIALNTYSNNRPGDAIRFAGNQTLDEPDGYFFIYKARDENHSMDYYRKIVDNVDASSWLKILNESGDQTVFLGGRQSGDNFLVDEGADVLEDTDLDQEDFDQLGDDDIEIFYGGRGNDTLTGGSSDELMLGGSGNDDIDGSKGIDTAAYSGARANYSLQLNERLLFADQRIVTDRRTGIDNDGVDTLEDIERLIFSDLGVAFDLDGNAGGVAKILGAIFGASSISNKQFVGTGLKLLDNGMSFQDAIQLALNSKLGEGFSNADEVNLLYKNLLGVLPSTDDLNSWVGKLNSGELSHIPLAELAINFDLNETNIDLVGLQQTGIEFV